MTSRRLWIVAEMSIVMRKCASKFSLFKIGVQLLTKIIVLQHKNRQETVWKLVLQPILCNPYLEINCAKNSFLQKGDWLSINWVTPQAFFNNLFKINKIFWMIRCQSTYDLYGFSLAPSQRQCTADWRSFLTANADFLRVSNCVS